MSDLLKIDKFSEISFVVRDNNRSYNHEIFKKLGYWNPNLINGPGWVFANIHRKNIENYVNNFNSIKNVYYNSGPGHICSYL